MRNSFFVAFLIIGAFTLFFWYLVASSFFDVSLAHQKKFQTDGCTLFVDSSWKQCCMVHDKQYWQGGSVEERHISNTLFRDCIYDTSDKKMLSIVMYGAVRAGGTPYFAVPWRWGYGWEFGRGYR
ncbi:MAG: hypothetical protein U9Q12_03300 [Patescibacteria group bacterium]|nr:hypothetical protein [Patescibacteria group bacterium]